MRRDCDQPKIDRVGPPVVCASVHDTQNRVPLEAGGEVLQRPTERITIFVSGKRPKFHLDGPIVVPMALVNSFDGICIHDCNLHRTAEPTIQPMHANHPIQ